MNTTDSARKMRRAKRRKERMNKLKKSGITTIKGIEYDKERRPDFKFEISNQHNDLIIKTFIEPSLDGFDSSLQDDATYKGMRRSLSIDNSPKIGRSKKAKKKKVRFKDTNSVCSEVDLNPKERFDHEIADLGLNSGKNFSYLKSKGNERNGSLGNSAVLPQGPMFRTKPEDPTKNYDLGQNFDFSGQKGLNSLKRPPLPKSDPIEEIDAHMAELPRMSDDLTSLGQMWANLGDLDNFNKIRSDSFKRDNTLEDYATEAVKNQRRAGSFHQTDFKKPRAAPALISSKKVVQFKDPLTESPSPPIQEFGVNQPTYLQIMRQNSSETSLRPENSKSSINPVEPSLNTLTSFNSVTRTTNGSLKEQIVQDILKPASSTTSQLKNELVNIATSPVIQGVEADQILHPESHIQPPIMVNNFRYSMDPEEMKFQPMETREAREVRKTPMAHQHPLNNQNNLLIDSEKPEMSNMAIFIDEDYQEPKFLSPARESMQGAGARHQIEKKLKNSPGNKPEVNKFKNHYLLKKQENVLSLIEEETSALLQNQSSIINSKRNSVLAESDAKPMKFASPSKESARQLEVVLEKTDHSSSEKKSKTTRSEDEKGQDEVEKFEIGDFSKKAKIPKIGSFETTELRVKPSGNEVGRLKARLADLKRKLSPRNKIPLETEKSKILGNSDFKTRRDSSRSKYLNNINTIKDRSVDINKKMSKISSMSKKLSQIKSRSPKNLNTAMEAVSSEKKWKSKLKLKSAGIQPKKSKKFDIKVDESKISLVKKKVERQRLGRKIKLDKFNTEVQRALKEAHGRKNSKVKNSPKTLKLKSRARKGSYLGRIRQLTTKGERYASPSRKGSPRQSPLRVKIGNKNKSILSSMRSSKSKKDSQKNLRLPQKYPNLGKRSRSPKSMQRKLSGDFGRKGFKGRVSGGSRKDLDANFKQMKENKGVGGVEKKEKVLQHKLFEERARRILEAKKKLERKGIGSRPVVPPKQDNSKELKGREPDITKIAPEVVEVAEVGQVPEVVRRSHKEGSMISHIRSSKDDFESKLKKSQISENDPFEASLEIRDLRLIETGQDFPKEGSEFSEGVKIEPSTTKKPPKRNPPNLENLRNLEIEKQLRELKMQTILAMNKNKETQGSKHTQNEPILVIAPDFETGSRSKARSPDDLEKTQSIAFDSQFGSEGLDRVTIATKLDFDDGSKRTTQDEFFKGSGSPKTNKDILKAIQQKSSNLTSLRSHVLEVEQKKDNSACELTKNGDASFEGVKEGAREERLTCPLLQNPTKIEKSQIVGVVENSGKNDENHDIGTNLEEDVDREQHKDDFGPTKPAVEQDNQNPIVMVIEQFPPQFRVRQGSLSIQDEFPENKELSCDAVLLEYDGTPALTIATKENLKSAEILPEAPKTSNDQALVNRAGVDLPFQQIQGVPLQEVRALMSKKDKIQLEGISKISGLNRGMRAQQGHQRMPVGNPDAISVDSNQSNLKISNLKASSVSSFHSHSGVRIIDGKANYVETGLPGALVQSKIIENENLTTEKIPKEEKVSRPTLEVDRPTDDTQRQIRPRVSKNSSKKSSPKKSQESKNLKPSPRNDAARAKRREMAANPDIKFRYLSPGKKNPVKRIVGLEAILNNSFGQGDCLSSGRKSDRTRKVNTTRAENILTSGLSPFGGDGLSSRRRGEEVEEMLSGRQSGRKEAERDSEGKEKGKKEKKKRAGGVLRGRISMLSDDEYQVYEKLASTERARLKEKQNEEGIAPIDANINKVDNDNSNTLERRLDDMGDEVENQNKEREEFQEKGEGEPAQQPSLQNGDDLRAEEDQGVREVNLVDFSPEGQIEELDSSRNYDLVHVPNEYNGQQHDMSQQIDLSAPGSGGEADDFGSFIGDEDEEEESYIETEDRLKQVTANDPVQDASSTFEINSESEVAVKTKQGIIEASLASSEINYDPNIEINQEKPPISDQEKKLEISEIQSIEDLEIKKEDNAGIPPPEKNHNDPRYSQRQPESLREAEGQPTHSQSQILSVSTLDKQPSAVSLQSAPLSTSAYQLPLKTPKNSQYPSMQLQKPPLSKLSTNQSQDNLQTQKQQRFSKKANLSSSGYISNLIQANIRKSIQIEKEPNVERLEVHASSKPCRELTQDLPMDPSFDLITEMFPEMQPRLEMAIPIRQLTMERPDSLLMLYKSTDIGGQGVVSQQQPMLPQGVPRTVYFPVMEKIEEESSDCDDDIVSPRPERPSTDDLVGEDRDRVDEAGEVVEAADVSNFGNFGVFEKKDDIENLDETETDGRDEGRIEDKGVTAEPLEQPEEVVKQTVDQVESEIEKIMLEHNPEESPKSESNSSNISGADSFETAQTGTATVYSDVNSRILDGSMRSIARTNKIINQSNEDDFQSIADNSELFNDFQSFDDAGNTRSVEQMITDFQNQNNGNNGAGVHFARRFQDNTSFVTLFVALLFMEIMKRVGSTN